MWTGELLLSIYKMVFLREVDSKRLRAELTLAQSGDAGSEVSPHSVLHGHHFIEKFRKPTEDAG